MSPSIPWADVVEVGASMLTADVRDRVGLPQGPARLAARQGRRGGLRHGPALPGVEDQQGPARHPHPRTRKLERLRENFGAASVAITAEEIAAIDAKLDTMEFDVFGGHAAK